MAHLTFAPERGWAQSNYGARTSHNHGFSLSLQNPL